jgi:metallophosphoesterase (TIGR00282 family)
MPAELRILFLGDVIGRPGRQAMDHFLPALVEELDPTLMVANAENAAGGVGLTENIGRELLSRVDVLTSGNHIWDKKEVLGYLGEEPRILRPANYPDGTPGRGSHIWESRQGEKVGILNLQGRVFMEPIDCPFRVAEREVAALRKITPMILVDFHAEATSEKQALGWFLDGSVSAVIGTHTHVLTADERVLPQGTAYITDAGMVGGYDSVIGINREPALQRFLTSRPQRFEPSKEGRMLAAVVVDVDRESGRALRIQRRLLIGEAGHD